MLISRGPLYLVTEESSIYIFNYKFKDKHYQIFKNLTDVFRR